MSQTLSGTSTHDEVTGRSSTPRDMAPATPEASDLNSLNVSVKASPTDALLRNDVAQGFPHIDKSALGYASMERILGTFSGKKVLVIAAGGGGDLVGTLPLAWSLKHLGAAVYAAGISLKRRSHDPLGLARSISEFEGIKKVNNYIGKVDPNTYINHQGKRMIYHIEADISLALEDEFPIYTIDPSGGIGKMTDAVRDLMAQEGIDHVIIMDVGGDIICYGKEKTIRSPLCDQFSLAVGASIPGSLTGVVGLGSDGEFPLSCLERRVAELAVKGGFHGGYAIPPELLGKWGCVLENAQTECSKHPMRICMRNLDHWTGEYNFNMNRAQYFLDNASPTNNRPLTPEEAFDSGELVMKAASIDREDVSLRNGARVGELSALTGFNLFFSSDVLYSTNFFSQEFDPDDSFEACGAKLDKHGIIHEIHDRD